MEISVIVITILTLINLIRAFRNYETINFLIESGAVQTKAMLNHGECLKSIHERLEKLENENK